MYSIIFFYLLSYFLSIIFSILRHKPMYRYQMKKKLTLEQQYFLYFTLIGIVYVFNMLVDVMDVDAAQYASLSLEMLQNGNYLEVYERGHDYLDKPPLLFWVSALSFKLLGVSNFSYKLPAVLVLILGIYSTYRFTLLWYDKSKALLAALILATTQGYMLMTNDVRTDGILTGMVMFAVWQLSTYIRTYNMAHLCLGAVGIAGAMMTKGPLGIVLVGFAIGGDLLLKRQWKDVFKWQWILLLVLVLILLLPMCYGLYTQFDLHPEKEVYGLKGPSGLRFFFWTQSFGRITGESQWDNGLGPFFFCHSILWDMQPWVLFMIPALFIRTYELVQTRFKITTEREYISFCGFFIGFLALSASRFKLPHYIFPLFPFAAVWIADYIHTLFLNKSKFDRILPKVHFGLLNAFFLVILLYFVLFFSPQGVLLPIVCAVLFILCWLSFRTYNGTLESITMPTISMSFALGLVMSSHFYPNLLQYQSGSVVGKYIKDHHIPYDRFYAFNFYAHSLDFYRGNIVPDISEEQLKNAPKGTLVVVDQERLDYLIKTLQLKYKIVKEVKSFKVTALEIDFLMKSTRAQTLKSAYIIEKL